MHTKIPSAPTLLVVLAFLGLPAAATASNEPTLTYPTGSLLPVGSKIRGTNVGGFKVTTTSGTILWECPLNQVTGTLRKNSGSEVEADIESVTVAGTGLGGACTKTGIETHWIVNPETNGLPWCLRSTPAMKEDEVQIRGGACSGASRSIRTVFRTTITGETPSVVDCVYEHSGAITGTYTTHPSSDAIMTFNGSEWALVAGTFICGISWKLDMTITLEKDEGTTSPTYIS